jgi:type II secretory pathway pseudopilin PulG
MDNELRKKGFSLTEVLLAVGTLAIGMLFIAGTFLAGIHFTTIATERTIAAVAADEAFAKIKLFGGIDTNWLSALRPAECNDFSELVPLNPDEFAYPSTNTVFDKQYYWSALCRRADPNLVQVTVFVSRKVSSAARYWKRNTNMWPVLLQLPYPSPVDVNVVQDSLLPNPYELFIIDLNPPPADTVDEATFINDGYTIVENTTGQIYRVLERLESQPGTGIFNRIILDKPWLGGPAGSVWVVPPSITGSRGPCIVVYQTEMRFQ